MMTYKNKKIFSILSIIILLLPYFIFYNMCRISKAEYDKQMVLNNEIQCGIINKLTKIKLINEISSIPHQPLGVNEEITNYNVFDFKSREEYYTLGWVKNDNTPIWSRQDINSTVVSIVNYNDIINITFTNKDNWLKVKYNDNIIGYIEKQHISLQENEYHDFLISDYPGFKSYMDYRAIEIPTSAQYKLLSIYGYTDNGFRKVNGRYCIAVGSYFNTSIGQYIDLILENGVVIECIMGDLKADIHTEDNNIFTTLNKCCSEFIIDKDSLDAFVASTGNISRSNPSWDSPVKYVRVYNKNFFDTIGE